MPRAAGVCNKGPSGLHTRAHCVVLCTFTVKPIFLKVVNSTSRKSGSVAEGRVLNKDTKQHALDTNKTDKY